MKTPVFSRATAGALLASLSMTLLPIAAIAAFGDVGTSTQYKTAIDALQTKGIIEGYSDGSFKPANQINRAEFLKIVLGSAKITPTESDKNCFPDVKEEWFAGLVCAAKRSGIIEGYPDGLFHPEDNINFVEAGKILSLAYKQQIESYSPDWYEPYARALEGSSAIPTSIDSLERKITRGEMVEMMWRLSEGKTDQPAKAYLNVKYPEMAVNMASDTPQFAKSCRDLQAFTEEAARTGGRGGVMLRDSMQEGDAGAPVPSMAPQAGAMDKSTSNSHSETNVQVAGVDEADIVKTDGTYVYLVSNQKIRIIKADPASSMEQVGLIDLEDASFSPTDLYLDDGMLAVVGSRYSSGPINIMEKRMANSMIWPGYDTSKAEVRIYNVANPAKPELSRKVAFDGWAVSSRRIGDKLYMVVNQPYRYMPMPLTNPTNKDVVPQFEDSKSGDVQKPVTDCTDVMILPRIPSPQYLTVGVVPLKSATADVKSEVVLGNAENIYASLNNLYIASTDYQYYWRGAVEDSKIMNAPVEKTNLYRFNFTDDGISMAAQGTVPGRILNQFSMDEHENNFRIATTQGNSWNSTDPQTNNLYVLNQSMETVGEIEKIAPGEQIYSVRFMGDRAYMVTFRTIDPLFVIDVGDPRNPKILGKLKIPGFSNYLHPYDDNHIIGFGKDAVESKDGSFAWQQGMKIALFDVSDVEHPKELHKVNIGDRGTDSPLLYNHKALLFEKNEDGLLSFPITVSKVTDANRYPGQEPGSEYGSPVFQGAYVYHLTLDDGFKFEGSITHYPEGTFEKAGDMYYGYGSDVERVVRINDSLVTISQSGVQSHSIDGVKKEGDVTWKTE